MPRVTVTDLEPSYETVSEGGRKSRSGYAVRLWMFRLVATTSTSSPKNYSTGNFQNDQKTKLREVNMATGYTAPIEKGITFEEFVMGCARAFGACVTMRDDPSDTPIPDKFEPSDYHVKEIKKAKKAIKSLDRTTLDEAKAWAEKDFNDEVKAHEQGITKNNALRAKYVAMLNKVRAWQYPTDEHKELKSFMMEQIEKSIAFDCSNSYYKEQPPKFLTAEQWLAKARGKALQDLDYHTRENIREIENAEGRTQWVNALRKSLNKKEKS